ncbi:MAG: NTPase [Candidatus Freyarchaeota archaeon]|nr:NTPase [Candidatus Jordarchaeia archaeon]
MKKILVTGPPGCGKSTLAVKIIERAQSKGLKVGGVITPEVRKGGTRKGFLIVDLLTGENKIMASVGEGSPRVGRYVVYTSAVAGLGFRALRRAVEEADIIVVDEIGKMELIVDSFSQAVREAVSCGKPFLGTIGMKLEHPLVRELKARSDVELIFLRREKWQEKYEHVLRAFGI